jgi:hypothetical protein
MASSLDIPEKPSLPLQHHDYRPFPAESNTNENDSASLENDLENKPKLQPPFNEILDPNEVSSSAEN